MDYRSTNGALGNDPAPHEPEYEQAGAEQGQCGRLGYLRSGAKLVNVTELLNARNRARETHSDEIEYTPVE